MHREDSQGQRVLGSEDGAAADTVLHELHATRTGGFQVDVI